VSYILYIIRIFVFLHIFIFYLKNINLSPLLTILKLIFHLLPFLILYILLLCFNSSVFCAVSTTIFCPFLMRHCFLQLPRLGGLWPVTNVTHNTYSKIQEEHSCFLKLNIAWRLKQGQTLGVVDFIKIFEWFLVYYVWF